MYLKEIILGAMVTACLALSGWTLSAVADMPMNYVLKDDYKEWRIENREDHQEIKKMLDDIRNKLEKGE